MARKIKIDNAHQKREYLKARTATKRVSDIRKERRYFMIVCEGEKTEPNYFKGLKASLSPGILEVSEFKIEGTGYNTKSLLALAHRLKAKWENEIGRKVEKIWVVFDRDSFSPQDFNDTIAMCHAQMPDVAAAWTNEAFELWYLLHFDAHSNALNRQQYEKKLEAAFKGQGLKGFTYKKNDPDMFELLAKYGDPPMAFNRADKLLDSYVGRHDYASHNPCTTVHQMVRELQSL